jgi:ABC-type oligopeptide transport system substrate-binding subunit
MTSQIRQAGMGVVRLLGGLLALAALAAAAAGLPAPSQERKGPVKDGRTEDEDDGKGPVKNVKDKPTPEDDDSARSPRARALIQALSVAHDLVTLAGEKQGKPVPPLPLRAPDRLAEKAQRPVFDGAWRPSRDQIDLSPDGGLSVRPYEALVLEKVQGFLKEEPDPGERQAAAEKVLTAALRFHESARERRLRQGDGWEPVEKRLRDQLFAVLVERLDGLAQQRRWDEAFALARRLAYYSQNEPLRLAGPLARLLAQGEPLEKLQQAMQDRLPEPLAWALKAQTPRPEQIDEAFQHLRRLEKASLDPKAVQEVRERLRVRAQDLFDRARGEQDPSVKQGLLSRALELAPDLNGLSEELGKVAEHYKILKVGVRHRPEYFSPAWAATDAERRAVELLFESLVRYSPDEQGVWRYRTALAEGRPRLIPGGRRFRLPDNALWSNGRPIILPDVRETVNLLRQGKGQGLSPAWGELLNPVEVGGDARLELTLPRGFVEPLALMQFKVLPPVSQKDGYQGASNPVVDSKEFARNPVCSGPFKVGKAGTEKGRPFVSLVPNLNYGGRAGHRPPPFQEVRFIEYQDPVADFKEKELGLHLVLDLTADQAAQLREQADQLRLKAPLPDDLPPNRRVYFLLVNPEKHKALESAALRRAIAYAIDREALLLEPFRGKLQDPRLHKALNGPYPAGCWACKPELHSKSNPNSLDPYDADAARAAFQTFKEQGEGSLKAITLKYPKGDPELAKAMQNLCLHVNQTLKEVNLKPEECDVRALKTAVESSGDYQLAYWHYDFPDETFWLGPLLGPKGLARVKTEKTANLVVEATGMREFAEVRKLARSIHAEVLTEMPLIPLWQLDPLLAISKDLEAPPFDPRLVFSDIDRAGWRLRR